MYIYIHTLVRCFAASLSVSMPSKCDKAVKVSTAWPLPAQALLWLFYEHRVKGSDFCHKIIEDWHLTCNAGHKLLQRLTSAQQRAFYCCQKCSLAGLIASWWNQEAQTLRSISSTQNIFFATSPLVHFMFWHGQKKRSSTHLYFWNYALKSPITNWKYQINTAVFSNWNNCIAQLLLPEKSVWVLHFKADF